MTDELYSKLVCALTHDIKTCQECKKCGDGVEARLNLARELSKAFQRSLFQEEKHHNITFFKVDQDPTSEWATRNININDYNDYIAKINSFDRYILPDSYDNTINKLNSYNYVVDSAKPCIISTFPDGTPNLSTSIDAGPCIIDNNKNKTTYCTNIDADSAYVNAIKTYINK